MDSLLDPLLLLLVLVGWGAQAIVPWRRDAMGARFLRGWRVAAVPLAVAAVVAAYALADRNPDATIAAHLVPLRASLAGELLVLLAGAQLLAALLTSLGSERLDRTSWQIAAALGLATCAAAAWAGEELRLGGGPLSSGFFMALLVACRLALTLAAGELLTPGRSRWAAPCGLGVAAYTFLLPHDLRVELLHQGLLLTFGAAAVLLLVARWLPPALRRPALGTGLLLAAIALTQAAHISQDLMPLRQ
jgi:hypothetical protein